MSQILKFTGREIELKQIVDSWEIASNVENPIPQIILLKGERGVGKTRLALEFYNWLSVHSNNGYWPTADAVYQNAIHVNPKAIYCCFDKQIPYLWWGLHVSSSQNPLDTISCFDDYLAPHLAILLATSIKKKKGIELRDALFDLGIDIGLGLIQDLTYVGLFKRIAQGIRQGANIVNGALGEGSLDSVLSNQKSRAKLILQKFEEVFNPNNDYASVPGVLLIDDAQNVEPKNDPGILAFIEELFYKAVTQNWPLLIVVTHWKRELTTEASLAKPSFSKLLSHCLYGDAVGHSSLLDLPGGFLNDTFFKEIDIDPIVDLSSPLKEKLPGLTIDQSTGLLQAVGGNPRFLEQIIEFSKEQPGFFRNYDISQSLTKAGYKELLAETKNQDIFRTVRRRLSDVPNEVKEAICLASLQGPNFSSDLVNTIGKMHLGRSVKASLNKAETAFCWVKGIQENSIDCVGEFTEKLFYDVAVNLRPHIRSLKGESNLLMSFKKTVRSFVEDNDFINSKKLETQLITFNIAADLFEKSNDSDEYSIAQIAMSLIGYVHLRRNSFEASTAAYERLIESEPFRGGQYSMVEFNSRLEVLQRLAFAYLLLGWKSKAASTYKKMISMATWLADWELIMRLLSTRTPDELKNVIEEWKQKDYEQALKDGSFNNIEKNERDSIFNHLFIEKSSFLIISLVDGLLGLAELSLIWPNMKLRDGDDPILDTPLFLYCITDDNGKPSEEKPITDGPVLYSMLWQIAYNLGTIFHNSFAKMKHYEMLIQSNFDFFDDIKKSSRSRIDALERALLLAKRMNDCLLEIKTLVEMLSHYASLEEKKKFEETYKTVYKILEEEFVDDCFLVVMLDKGDIEYLKASNIYNEDNDRIIGEIQIPVEFSELFDRDPKEAVRKSKSLSDSIGDMDKILGAWHVNIGSLEIAEECLNHALVNYSNSNNHTMIADTYNMLGTIEEKRGKNSEACECWQRSLEIFQFLKENEQDILSIEVKWEPQIRMLKGIIKESKKKLE